MQVRRQNANVVGASNLSLNFAQPIYLEPEQKGHTAGNVCLSAHIQTVNTGQSQWSWVRAL
jgi:hypothetical protein